MVRRDAVKKKRTKIYVNVKSENHEIVYTGINFSEFIKFLSLPIENLILLKGDYYGNRQEFNFELLEGQEQIKKLSEENIYNYGDFGFVDYFRSGDTTRLSDQQIAELLYISHIEKPLESPFFTTLQNRFVYLAHDDGWYCKLYCRNPDDFITVLCKKISNDVSWSVPDFLRSRLLELATQGIIIDLEEIQKNNEVFDLKIYTVGLYFDMDCILNNFQKLKETATKTSTLKYNKKQWDLV